MIRRVLSLVFAAGFLALISAPFASAETPPGLERFMAAARRFNELQKAAQAKNTMPRLSDPEVGDLLRTLSDADGLFDSAAYDKTFLPVLGDACARANQILVAYNLAAPSDSPYHGVVDELPVSASAFLSERLPLQAFALRCFARLQPILKDVVLSLSSAEWTKLRRQVFEDHRQRVAGMFHAALTMLGASAGPVRIEWETLMTEALVDTPDFGRMVSEVRDIPGQPEKVVLPRLLVIDGASPLPLRYTPAPALPPPSRALMVSALAETAPALAGMMSVFQRQDILKRAQTVRVAKKSKPAFERFRAAMRRTDCEGLCQL